MMSTSRTAPHARGTKTKTGPRVACHFEIGPSESEGRGRTAGRTTGLTRREQQIIDLLLEGCENAEIAKRLTIALRTVKAYFNRLFLRFGITSGIKRVKLATFLYRSRLDSAAIFTGADAELNGNTASSLSTPRSTARRTSLEKLEPRSTASKGVFVPSTTSWECGTVSSLRGGARRALTMTRRAQLDAWEPGIFPSERMMLTKRGGDVGTWMFLSRAPNR
jgi:DNA-binding CsgD family transcriptional regulator